MRPSPFSGPAFPKDPNDLAWLIELQQKLADEPVTREQVIAFLGSDGGADPNNPRRQKVRAHSQYLANVVVYALPHIRIELALDVAFAENSRPGHSAVASAIGPLQSMPRAPDDFDSGPKFSSYKNGKRATARIFVELDPKDDSLVKAIHVDADGVK